MSTARATVRVLGEGGWHALVWPALVMGSVAVYWSVTTWAGW